MNLEFIMWVLEWWNRSHNNECQLNLWAKENDFKEARHKRISNIIRIYFDWQYYTEYKTVSETHGHTVHQANVNFK